MKIHDVTEESAIAMDLTLYGEALVRGTIPDWWGDLGRYLDQQLLEQMTEADRDSYFGEARAPVVFAPPAVGVRDPRRQW